jgi:hypothetical protein
MHIYENDKYRNIIFETNNTMRRKILEANKCSNGKRTVKRKDHTYSSV